MSRFDSFSSFPVTKEDPELGRTAGKTSSPIRQLISWIALGGLLLLILISVIVTGILFNRSVKKTENKHSLNALNTPFNQSLLDSSQFAVGVTISMNNFDPGSSVLSYDFAAFLDFFPSSDTEPTDGNAFPVCVFAVDPSSLNAPLSLSINYGAKTDFNSTSSNVTTDGSISSFPFDSYSGSLVMTALVLRNATNNETIDCSAYFDAVDDPSFTTFLIPVFFQVGQDLDAFSSRNPSPQLLSNDNLLAYFPDSSVLIPINIARRDVVRFFAVLMFIASWLLTLGIVLATAQILMYHSEGKFDIMAVSTGLLFALPSLRGATPGIPTTPTVSDAVGYFWNIALVALSTFVLMSHAIWHAKKNATKGDLNSKKDN